MGGFLVAYAGPIVTLNMDDALALEGVGVGSFSDQIDIGGGEFIDIMGMNPLAGFGQIGFSGATLCASPTDATSGSGSAGTVRYVY